jgi:hypothetical protein
MIKFMPNDCIDCVMDFLPFQDKGTHAAGLSCHAFGYLLLRRIRWTMDELSTLNQRDRTRVFPEVVSLEFATDNIVSLQFVLNQTALFPQLTRLTLCSRVPRIAGEDHSPGPLVNQPGCVDWHERLPRVLLSLPSTLTHLVLDDQFHFLVINACMYETAITELVVGDCFNLPIAPRMLPKFLETLDFGDEYNQPLALNVLPETLAVLKFGAHFNQAIDADVIPRSVRVLVFGSDFDKPIGQKAFPQALTKLVFGYSFNQELDAGVLPESLQSIYFGHCFNQPIWSNVIPRANLTSVVFGDCFNQFIYPSAFSDSTLREIVFGRDFNQQIPIKAFPMTLKVLQFGRNFNKTFFPGSIPSSVTDLEFGHDFNSSLVCRPVPDFVTCLTGGYGTYRRAYSKHEMSWLFDPPSALPESLQRLRFGCRFNQPGSNFRLPEGLSHLIFGNEFNQTLEGIRFPVSLHTLLFGNSFNHLVGRNMLPPNLAFLRMGDGFNQPIHLGDKSRLVAADLGGFNLPLHYLVFPDQITNVSFNRFNQKLLKGGLPQQVRSLDLGDTFNRSITQDALPPNLYELRLGRRFMQPLPLAVLPSKLENLTMVKPPGQQGFEHGEVIAPRLRLMLIQGHAEQDDEKEKEDEEKEVDEGVEADENVCECADCLLSKWNSVS